MPTKKTVCVFFFFFYCWLCCCIYLPLSMLHAQSSTTRDLTAESKIETELAQRAPPAVPFFRQATAALDRGNYTEAIKLYQQVQQLAPEFDATDRRMGIALVSTGKRNAGLALLRRAHQRHANYENTAALATGLATATQDEPASQAERTEAMQLLQQMLPITIDAQALQLLAGLQFELKEFAAFQATAKRLVSDYPNEMSGHYFAALSASLDEDWDKAERELQRAQALGLPAATAQEFRDKTGLQTQQNVWRFVHYALYLTLLWLAGLGALFMLGKCFSTQTLKRIEDTDPNGAATSPREQTLRTWYRRLINFASVYYYLSLPMVLLLVAGLVSGIFSAFWVMGHIPVKIVAFLAVGAGITIYQSVRSLFTKIESNDPGRALQPAEAPGLWALTREVAQVVGTRPLDEIRVTPGCEMAVYEKGDFRAKLRDEAKRVLILGVGTLNGMQQNALRAVLAHEYGHFSNRDTAGGEIALRVEQDMAKFALALAFSGQAVWWNLAYQFLQIYHFIFRRLSHGATRLQEIMADRIAVKNYGAAAFETGLRHVIRREVEFGKAAEAEIEAAAKQRRALNNLYQLPAIKDGFVQEMIEQETQEIITRPTSEDDTHPSPIDRFRLAARIHSPAQLPPDAPAWELFADPAALTAEMSSQINENVRAYLEQHSAEPSNNQDGNKNDEDGPKFTLIDD